MASCWSSASLSVPACSSRSHVQLGSPEDAHSFQAVGEGLRDTRAPRLPSHGPPRSQARAQWRVGARARPPPYRSPSPVPPLPGPDLPMTQAPGALCGPRLAPCLGNAASLRAPALQVNPAAQKMPGLRVSPSQGTLPLPPGAPASAPTVYPSSVEVPVSARDVTLFSLAPNSTPRGPVSKVTPPASRPLRRDAGGSHVSST